MSERDGAAGVPFVKAHGYGNDFLLVDARRRAGALPPPELARALCRRHHGVGADGVIFYRRTRAGASMRLFNADGSQAELSGNGVRCLAALLVDRRRGGAAGAAAAPLAIATAGGVRTLTLLDAAPPRYTFRADMGAPRDLREETLTVEGMRMRIVSLSLGNPHCVVFAPSRGEAEALLARLGPALTAHARFPDGVNVEIAVVERPDRVRIVIWERGVGPTQASGTGACAAAVAAARYGGAARRVDVVSPGGAQQVDWTDGVLQLTGWADLVARGRWLGRAPSA